MTTPPFNAAAAKLTLDAVKEAVEAVQAVFEENIRLQGNLASVEAESAALRQALHQYVYGPEPFEKVRRVFESNSVGIALLAKLRAAEAVVSAARRYNSRGYGVENGALRTALDEALSAYDEER